MPSSPAICVNGRLLLPSKATASRLTHPQINDGSDPFDAFPLPSELKQIHQFGGGPAGHLSGEVLKLQRSAISGSDLCKPSSLQEWSHLFGGRVVKHGK